MRVVFMGSSDFAEPSLKAISVSSHQIVAVVTPVNKPAGRGRGIKSPYLKLVAEKLGYPVLQPNSFKDEKSLKNLRDCFPDIIVIVAFRKLPDNVLDIPKYGCINLHPSLLPKYRGAAPIQHAIIKGDNVTGVSIIKLSSKIDSGNILFQKEYQIINDENSGELSRRMSEYGSTHIVETLNEIEANNTLPGIRQNESEVSFAPKLEVKACRINWEEKAIIIHNKIRGFAPKPGAFTFFKNKRVKLLRSQLLSEYEDSIQFDSEKKEKINNLTPGEIIMTKQKLFTGTGDGILIILELQPEGKRIMSNIEFISGHYKENINFD